MRGTGERSGELEGVCGRECVQGSGRGVRLQACMAVCVRMGSLIIGEAMGGRGEGVAGQPHQTGARIDAQIAGPQKRPRSRMTRAIVTPIWAGELVTVTPAASSA